MIFAIWRRYNIQVFSKLIILFKIKNKNNMKLTIVESRGDTEDMPHLKPCSHIQIFSPIFLLCKRSVIASMNDGQNGLWTHSTRYSAHHHWHHTKLNHGPFFKVKISGWISLCVDAPLKYHIGSDTEFLWPLLAYPYYGIKYIQNTRTSLATGIVRARLRHHIPLKSFLSGFLFEFPDIKEGLQLRIYTAIITGKTYSVHWWNVALQNLSS